MENNQENELDKTQIFKTNDSEITDLGYLLNVILDYYLSSDQEDKEDWKKGTEFDKNVIPETINELVEKAFVSQLNKFIK